MANALKDKNILMKGTCVWAHYINGRYFHGRIAKIQGTTTTVNFDNSSVMEYRNGHLTGEVLIDRKVDISELQEGLMVIVKMPRRRNGDTPMFKGVICAIQQGRSQRRCFVVQLKEHGERRVRKLASSLMIVENYQIKESEPADLMQWSSLSASKPTQYMLNSTIAVEHLPKPMSPEILWRNEDLIALQSLVENCESSFQEQLNELTVGACFDPLRQPASAFDAVSSQVGTSTPINMFNPAAPFDHPESSIYPSLSPGLAPNQQFSF